MALTPIRRACAAALTLGLLLAGCGDDDDDGDATATTETTTTEAEASASVEVTAVDYGYEGVPETVEAGTTLTLTNGSDAEIHELVAFKVPDGEERSADELMQLGEQELNAALGGPPVMVLVAPPSGAPQIAAVGTGELSAPGRYLYFCAIPVGADPAAYMEAAAQSQGGPPDVEGGPPHLTQGMYGELTVE